MKIYLSADFKFKLEYLNLNISFNCNIILYLQTDKFYLKLKNH